MHNIMPYLHVNAVGVNFAILVVANNQNNQ